jgi:hypothetical protein
MRETFVIAICLYCAPPPQNEQIWGNRDSAGNNNFFSSYFTFNIVIGVVNLG